MEQDKQDNTQQPEGLSLPSLEPEQEPGTVYMVETEDGFQTAVPEDKLAAWKRAQAAPRRPLNKAEQRVKDKIVSMFYGPKQD